MASAKIHEMKNAHFSASAVRSAKWSYLGIQSLRAFPSAPDILLLLISIPLGEVELESVGAVIEPSISHIRERCVTAQMERCPFQEIMFLSGWCRAEISRLAVE